MQDINFVSAIIKNRKGSQLLVPAGSIFTALYGQYTVLAEFLRTFDHINPIYLLPSWNKVQHLY